MNRRTSREKAMQVLFQLEINEVNSDQAIEDFIGLSNASVFLKELVNGVTENLLELDSIISENLENWSFDRLASVEKVVLRMATYEIEFIGDIPESVSINEAVELAKKFSDEKSGKFVNGVLSKIIS